MNGVVRPAADWELARFLQDATARGSSVEIVGGATKRDAGRPPFAESLISTHVMRGIRFHHPNELVMSAQSGTFLSDIQHELASHNQMLAFEPVDLGPLLGVQAGMATIGGTIATGISGSRRIAAGGTRDHVLGIKAVTGGGEIFQSGGRVLKNVTGYDIARIVTGSWGTLATMTEVTFKVLPMPEETATLVIVGLSNDLAIEAMSAAMGTPFDITGAVHIETALVSQLKQDEFRAAGDSITAFRLENFSDFLGRRIDRLRNALKTYGDVHVADNLASRSFWSELQELSVFVPSTLPVWRISTTPNKGAELVAGIQRYMDAHAYFDWAGGLIWLSVPLAADAGSTDIRRVMASHGGHATLIRASEEVRGNVDVFQPMDHGQERLTRGLKRVFDPAGILNPGRMYVDL